MDTAQLIAALAWQVEAGADEAVDEAPTDWTARRPAPGPAVRDAGRADDARRRVDPPAVPATPPAAPPPPRSAPVAVSGPVPLGAAEAATEARRLAAAAPTLEALRDAVAAFEGCPLKLTATSTVFADGVPGAPVMIVGEAPGEEEDRHGKPFVGPAGRLLDRMLVPVGLSRDRDVYITNVLPWRPPGNRKPSAAEMAICMPFLDRHVALVAPRILIVVGGTAASALLDRQEGITRLRGKWFAYERAGLPAPIPVLATFHPAYLLRTPAAKRESWRDLLMLRRRLDELGL
jgi:DNA polymerase